MSRPIPRPGAFVAVVLSFRPAHHHPQSGVQRNRRPSRQYTTFDGHWAQVGAASLRMRKRTVGLSSIVRSSSAVHGGQPPHRSRNRHTESRSAGRGGHGTRGPQQWSQQRLPLERPHPRLTQSHSHLLCVNSALRHLIENSLHITSLHS